jgi:hypothetical protein
MRAENIAVGEVLGLPLFIYSLFSLCLKKSRGLGQSPKQVPIIYKGGLMSIMTPKARYFIVGKIR